MLCLIKFTHKFSIKMAETPLSPSYYKRGSIDVWDFIRDQELSFHLGNAIKYICRSGHKNSAVEDLEKAIVYLQNELTHAKRKNLSRQDTDDVFVYSGSGIQGGLSNFQFQGTPLSDQAKEFDR